MKIFISLIILLLFVSFFNSSLAQKNSIKGMPGLIPVSGMYTVSISLGYERHISQHSAIELGGFYILFIDEMGLVYHNYALMPAYKFYFISKHKPFNNIWLSIYGLYIYSTHIHTEDGNFRCWKNYLGGGGSIGKRIYLNETKQFFMDIGFGIAATNVKSNSNNDYSKNILRPILQFGYKF